jgi:hypothetical protein
MSEARLRMRCGCSRCCGKGASQNSSPNSSPNSLIEALSNIAVPGRSISAINSGRALKVREAYALGATDMANGFR